LFYFFNSDYFSNNILLSILEGIRFDISALFYINLPLLILLIFPTNFREKKLYQKITNILFYLINIPFIVINNVDIEYFKFSQKRTTSDFFEYIALGNGADAFKVIPNYIIEFPNVTIIIIIQIFLLLKIKYLPKEKIQNIFIPFALFILSIGIFVLGARGGSQLKPIKPIDAGILSNTQNSVLVLNSPFCILHTFLEKGLTRHNYFSEDEIDKVYPTAHKFEGDFKKKNVVIIILESFSKEYIGYYNNGSGYTPFLDSIIPHSLVMENGYANGIKSIEALPAITSSVPTLMNESFITSPYATNNYYSIASLLKKEGYSTSFFHGGTRGTMGFYQFSKKAGFDKYFGLEEYGKEEDNDGVWGIYDGPFFKYFSDYLNKEQQPFISSIFSITSHPPFTLPQEFENTFPKGELEIHKTIGYTDFVLEEFFEREKKQEWYNNTLFVITADHTSPESKKSEYKNKVGRYSIPIIYFMGDTSEKGSVENITQQIDIMPTILDLLGYNKQFFSFGRSIFSDESWAISYLNNEYLLIHEDGFIIDRDNKKINYSDRKLKTKTEENLKANNFLNSIKQKYNNKLIDNKMNTDEN
jgi:phosphoglycerol transferase MdoB-like AlkP superfamily enzyme